MKKLEFNDYLMYAIVIVLIASIIGLRVNGEDLLTGTLNISPFALLAIFAIVIILSLSWGRIMRFFKKNKHE